jgi:hypothetical protein
MLLSNFKCSLNLPEIEQQSSDGSIYINFRFVYYVYHVVYNRCFLNLIRDNRNTQFF